MLGCETTSVQSTYIHFADFNAKKYDFGQFFTLFFVFFAIFAFLENIQDVKGNLFY
jgi:hypothetical protein